MPETVGDLDKFCMILCGLNRFGWNLYEIVSHMNRYVPMDSPDSAVILRIDSIRVISSSSFVIQAYELLLSRSLRKVARLLASD